MHAPEFWWRPPGFTSALLAPFGALYGAVVAARMKGSGVRTSIPVICIGDLTVGGSGKTPVAIAVAKLLTAQGQRPYFVTRGYGGRARGPLVVEKNVHDAREVGDEPLLLARIAPTVISKDRVLGAELAEKAGATVIVMDDGFQNPALVKDCSLLVIDGAAGVGNGRVFPAGPLRAPLIMQIERAQAIICVGEGAAGQTIAQIGRERNIPVISAGIRPEPKAAGLFTKQRLLAFAGIGWPEKFFKTLEGIGATVIERRVFPDHHNYSVAEAHGLLADAKAGNLTLVTTEKDLLRSAGDPALRELVAATRALPITLEFDDENGLKQLIAKTIARTR